MCSVITVLLFALISTVLFFALYIYEYVAKACLHFVLHPGTSAE